MIILVPLIILVGMLYGINARDYKTIYRGGAIEVIDPAEYFTPYKLIGLKNVKIYNSENGTFTGANIILNNGVIATILPEDSLASHVEYIDGKEGYLMPGLIDTHVHLANSKNDLYLYLAHGVTGICEMFGNEKHLQWRLEQESGSIGPKMFVATPKIGRLDGIRPFLSRFYRGQVNYPLVNSVRNAVRGFKDAGFDAIKIGSFIDQELFEAVLAESSIQHIKVIGHLGQGVDFDFFLNSSQIQIAHIDEISKHLEIEFGALNNSNLLEYSQFVESRAPDIARKLKEHGKVVSTTLFSSVNRPNQFYYPEKLLGRAEISFVNPQILDSESHGWTKSKPTPVQKEILAAKAAVVKTITRALVRQDVPLLPGSDANMFGMIPGVSLHDELKTMAEAGVPIARILNSATRDAAIFMEEKAGKIEPGYDANLILLRKNPLNNISNTESIELLFYDQYYLTKNNMENMLLAITRANEQYR